jgi:hypothetical protein
MPDATAPPPFSEKLRRSLEVRMKSSQLVLVAALLLPLPAASAQRVEDGRAGMPPVHQDSTRPSREALFVRRAVQSSFTAVIAMVPFAVYAMQQDGAASENLMIGGALSYLGAATLGAARRRSSNCSLGTRVWRASGGALAGMSAGLFWHIAADGDEYYQHHANDARTRVSAASFIVGVPLGAAAALYNCR